VLGAKPPSAASETTVMDAAVTERESLMSQLSDSAR
jgi:hypothetical protein